MKLFKLALNNPQLRYRDALTDKLYTAMDFDRSLAIPDEKSLAFLYLDNQIHSVEVLLNFFQLNHTVALLSPKLNVDFKEELERKYRPAYIYDPTRSEISGFRRERVSEAIHLFRNTQPLHYPIHAEVKLLLSTSGSTGSPKLVKLSEENLVQNALSIIDYLPIRQDDVTPLNLPLYYSYGLSVFTTHTLAGGEIVCSNRDVLQKEFWEEFSKYGYTSLAGVPYMYEILHRIGFCKKEHPSLRYLTQAGGKLNQELVKLFGEYAAQHHLPFYVMYGQTEATARMSYLPPESLLQKLGSIGKAIKNGHFSLEANGELVYSGPNVFGGYASSYHDLASFDAPSQLHTGDIGTCDEEGFYYITGRIKRFAKLFGTRINLDEVESILKNELNNGTFICTNIDDKFLSVMHLSPSLDDKAIQQVLKDKLGLPAASIKIKCIPTVPLTPNGKVDYKEVVLLS